MRDDGQLFNQARLSNSRPLAELGVHRALADVPPPDRLWSAAGVKRYLAGARPDPAAVFAQLRAVVDRFMDFNRSFAPQAQLCALVAVYILVTYLLDACHVVGYLWPWPGCRRALSAISML